MHKYAVSYCAELQLFKIFPIIENLAEEKDFSIVFDLAAGETSLFNPVVYFEPAIDITEKSQKNTML